MLIFSGQSSKVFETQAGDFMKPVVNIGKHCFMLKFNSICHVNSTEYTMLSQGRESPAVRVRDNQRTMCGRVHDNQKGVSVSESETRGMYGIFPHAVFYGLLLHLTLPRAQ